MDKIIPKTEMELAEFLAAPLGESQVRVLYCGLCGALTYLKFGSASEFGDPFMHNKYHTERGEKFDERQ